MFDVHALFGTLAERLWAIYHDHDGGPRPILPTKRDSSRRMSEQESKILACRTRTDGYALLHRDPNHRALLAVRIGLPKRTHRCDRRRILGSV